ncbi:Cullin-associated NEDD8-dissociated protein 2 [Mortierella sp. NVP85]|nr:Cullin-associated NEDD8-dissociated protein 2 [Mortierella sp. NVP85]
MRGIVLLFLGEAHGIEVDRPKTVDGGQAIEKQHANTIREAARQKAADRSNKCLDTLEERIDNDLKIRKHHFSVPEQQWLYGFENELPVQTYDELLNDLKPLISDKDLHLLSVGLTSVVAILHANSSSINVVKQEILPSVFKLVRSSLIQGQALDSLLALLQPLLLPMTRSSWPGSVHLLSHQFALSKHAFSTIAQYIAVLCINSDKIMETSVSEYVCKLEDIRSTVSLKYLSLVTLGEIGRPALLSGYTTLHTPVWPYSTYTRKRFAPLQRMQSGAITCTNYAQRQGDQELKAHASEIWMLSFHNSESQEEGTRNVVAECLGKPTLTDSYKFLPELQTRLRSESPQIRETETNVGEDLINVVELRPSRHRVDDGLEIRKSSFECMYTLLEKCKDKVEILVFIDRILVYRNDTLKCSAT